MRSSAERWRGRLFQKYVGAIVLLVSGVLLASGLVQVYFAYGENESVQLRLQEEKAAAAAATLQRFTSDVVRDMTWTQQPEWVPEILSLDRRQDDYARLLRQVPAITELTYLDPAGREQLYLSQVATNRRATDADFAATPQFRLPRPDQPYFGPVYYRDGSEPFMTVAVAEPGASGGVTVAEVSLRFLWDVILPIKIGPAGYAYVVDAQGDLIAHPDLSLVLKKTNLAALRQVQAALADPAHPDAAVVRDPSDRAALSAYHAIVPPGWTVFVEQPLQQALAPLYASAQRTALLLLVGVGLSVLFSLVLARKMVGPIRALQASAARIGAGALDERIAVRTGDELEALADEFNQMTARLHESYRHLEDRVVERTQDLAAALHELEIANRHKSHLLATVSHELRTPLGAIKGYGTALLRFGPRIRAPQRREFLESINNATDRLVTLIDDLLLAQRLEAGALPIQREPVGVGPLVVDVIVEVAAQTRDYRLVSAVPDTLPLAWADEQRIRQVLTNLVTNAAKYSPAGTEIHVTATTVAGVVRVSVQDQGQGLAPDQLERVFEPFHQIDGTFAGTQRGTGLGLTICRGIVAAHGGRIWAESPGPGQGSTFSFTVPLWVEGDAAVAPAPLEGDGAAAPPEAQLASIPRAKAG